MSNARVSDKLYRGAHAFLAASHLLALDAALRGISQGSLCNSHVLALDAGLRGISKGSLHSPFSSTHCTSDGERVCLLCATRRVDAAEASGDCCRECGRRRCLRKLSIRTRQGHADLGRTPTRPTKSWRKKIDKKWAKQEGKPTGAHNMTMQVAQNRTTTLQVTSTGKSLRERAGMRQVRGRMSDADKVNKPKRCGFYVSAAKLLCSLQYVVCEITLSACQHHGIMMLTRVTR